MKLLTFILLYFSCLNLGFAQLVDLSNWKLDSLPQGERLIESNHSKDNWLFVGEDGKYIVVQNNYKRDTDDGFPFQNEMSFTLEVKSQKFNSVIKFGNRKVHRVDDGYIVGTNNGEFRSGLFFVDNNATNRYIINFGFRIKSIYEFNSKLYAIEGLGHMGISKGSVIEIYKDSLWTYREVLKLEDAPNLILKAGPENLILTSQFLYKQTADKIEKVLKSPFYWGTLYPSSMVLEDKDLYIAMRQGILKIVSFQQDPRFEWYIPK